MDVEPYTKERQLYPVASLCPCGCGHVGAPRKAMMKDGLHHARGCPCRRCVGSRSKHNAAPRERKLGKAVGGKRNIGSGAFGGVDTVGGVCDVEETSNAALIRGFRSWWTSKQITRKLTPLMRIKLKPRAFVLFWEGRHRVAILPYEDFVALCDAACGPERAS